MPFAATWMDLEMTLLHFILSEVRKLQKSEREGQIYHVESKKMVQMNLQNRNRVRK